MKIGIIGGTGKQGQGLALRLAMAGHDIKIGSRNLEKAKLIIGELNTRIDNVAVAMELLFPENKMDWVEKKEFSTIEELRHAKKNLLGKQNEDAVRDVDAVFLTVPFLYARDTLRQLLPNMSPDTILVDVTVPLKKIGKTFVCDVFPEGSGSKYISAIVPKSIPVVCAFKTISAHRLIHIEKPIECVDVFVASDNHDARSKIVEVANSIRYLRGISFGALLCSASLEMMAAALININIHHKTKQTSFRITI